MRRLNFPVILITFTLLNFLFSHTALAKRLLPHLIPPKTNSFSKTYLPVSRGVSAKVKFRPDRLGILVTFSNLDLASRLSYQLTYTSLGVQQGTISSVNLQTGENSTREILFGTCSAGVCRFHENIQNARFTVTTTLKNGIQIVKPFRLKI